MTLAQRTAVSHAIWHSPHLMQMAVRRNLKNLSPSKHVQASKLGSVRYAIRKERKNLIAVQFKDVGIEVTDSHGSLAELCEAMLLTSLIRKHNDGQAWNDHLGMHTAVCVSYNLDGGKNT